VPRPRQIPPDPETETADVASGPRSAVRIVKILRFVAERPEGASLAALSTGLAAPKTSLLSLLRALSESDYLEQSDGRYRLGRAAFTLGSAIVARRRFPGVAMPVLRKLAAESGETAFISELLPEEDVAVYVARAESANPIRFMAEIGERRALYSSSGGRVLLAFQPEAWQDAYLRRTKLVPHTSSTVTDKKQLRELLRSIRDTGLSRTHEDVHVGVSAFAAPIFAEDREVIAALALAAPSSRADAIPERLSDLVRAAAGEISRILGHEDPR
jgi:DNA-binding IclR family transcriptional regulator